MVDRRGFLAAGGTVALNLPPSLTYIANLLELNEDGGLQYIVITDHPATHGFGKQHVAIAIPEVSGVDADGSPRDDPAAATAQTPPPNTTAAAHRAATDRRIVRLPSVSDEYSRAWVSS